MVLPSNEHVVLCDWLTRHGVIASEMAGLLIIGDLDSLLAVTGSGHRLTAEERATVTDARRAARDTDPSGGLLPSCNVMDLRAAVCETLEEVCRALGRAGVAAVPYEGLGVLSGDELLEAKVLISDLNPLYERMGATA